MRKPLLLVLLIGLLLASLAFLAGCGGSKTVKTPEGNVTTQDNGNSGTVTTPDGSTTYNNQAPTEQQLGAPIYPGVDYVQGSGGSASGTSSGGQYSASSAEFTTSDSFDSVVNWYKGTLGTPLYSGAGQSSDVTQEATWISSTSGNTVAVSVEAKGDGRTHITIGSYGGTGSPITTP